jgi:hypothetical protein
VTLTLPPGLERRPRVRRRRRRLALGALLALAAVLLAAGLWLPARAERGPSAPNRAEQRTTVADAAAKSSPRGGAHAAEWLATLAVGDELMLERPDGSIDAYEVTSLDVVDSRRTELAPDADENVVVLVSVWPFENVTVGGSWRYVVTARSRF